VTLEDKLRAAGITPTIDACAAYRLALADKSANGDNARPLPITVWQPKKR